MVTGSPSTQSTLDLRLATHRCDMMMVWDKLRQARQRLLHRLRDLAT